MAILPDKQRLLSRLLICSGAMAAFLAWPVGAQAQDNSAFHEIETKYIFGNFTVGSSTGLQGEMAFEPESEADFGKRFGNYVATGTALEFEYTPNQFMQVEFGPTVSYYNINNVPGLDNRNMLGVNGFESDFRFLLRTWALALRRNAVLEPEFHSLDETSGASVQNYGLETKIEADTELIKNRLFLAFNLLYEPETTGVATMAPRSAGATNRRSAYHRRSPSRSSRRSLSASISGICATTMAWPSTRSLATPSISARPSFGRSRPRCSSAQRGRLRSPGARSASRPRWISPTFPASELVCWSSSNSRVFLAGHDPLGRPLSSSRSGVFVAVTKRSM